MDVLKFQALGVSPVQQGSKRIGRNRATGKPIILDDNDKALKPWRSFVTMKARQAAAAAEFIRLEGPVAVRLVFKFARPASHFGTGRNRGTLKPSAPEHMTVKPDADKLVRAVLDSLTDAKVYKDDAQVTSLSVFKRYAHHGEEPGVVVAVASSHVDLARSAGSL